VIWGVSSDKNILIKRHVPTNFLEDPIFIPGTSGCSGLEVSVGEAEGVTVMVDCNYYLGSLDYELEIEFENGHDADAIKCMSEIEYIFSKINIPFYNKNEKCLSKSERFFKELDKLKIKEYAKEQYRNSVDSHYYVFEQNKKIVINSKIEKSLPTEQRLAIFLYNKMYRQSVSEMNKWIDESPDFIHNWDGEVHKKYLNMALGFLGGELK